MIGPAPFRAACIQLCSGTEVAENVAVVERLAREAAGEGARYIQTPEMTNILQRRRQPLEEAIRPEDGDPAVAAFARLAAELGVYLHIGSLALAAGAGRIANRALLFAPDGGIAARYDKIHLFDVDLAGGESWRESSLYQAGDRAVVADLPWCRIGIGICYDIRFPHLFRAQAHAGASLVTAPAAFTRQTGEAHWHILQRARAIENGAFVVSAAQAGRHQDGRETFGHSIIVGPWGEVLAEAGGDGPQVIVAEIDPARSAEARQRIPALKNERPFALPEPAAAQLRTLS